VCQSHGHAVHAVCQSRGHAACVSHMEAQCHVDMQCVSVTWTCSVYQSHGGAVSRGHAVCVSHVETHVNVVPCRQKQPARLSVVQEGEVITHKHYNVLRWPQTHNRCTCSAHTHTHTHTYTYTHIHTQAQIHTHTHAQARIHTLTHTSANTYTNCTGRC